MSLVGAPLKAFLVAVLVSVNAAAAVEWRQLENVPEMKSIVWQPPVRATGEIPYGCRTRFDDLLPRACLIIPASTCLIYSARTEKETDGRVKADLARICKGWFWVDHHELVMGVPWSSVPGRFPSQSVPKLP